MEDIKNILKVVNTEMRNAQNLMFNGKFEQSWELAEKVAGLIENARLIEPENFHVKTFDNQCNKLKRDLSSRMGRTPESKASTAAPQASSAPKPAPAEVSAEGPLDSMVARQLSGIIAQIEMGDLRNARNSLAYVEKNYAGKYHPEHPEFLEVVTKLAQAEQAQAAKEEAQEKEKETRLKAMEESEQQSAKWVEMLRELPYTSSLSPYAPSLLEEKERYESVMPLINEYQQQTFPNGKTLELEGLEKSKLSPWLEFPARWETACKGLFEAVWERIDSREKALSRDVKWQDDKQLRPHIINKKEIEELDKMVEEAALVLADEKTTSLREKLNDLKASNEERIHTGAERTFMGEDVYTGEDAAALKKFAEGIIAKGHPQAQILKTSIYKPQWHEVSQWEKYDGNSRYVTRREIYLQIAAAFGEETKLFTLYLTKEHRVDNTWSELSGHVMHIDSIVEANIA